LAYTNVNVKHRRRKIVLEIVRFSVHKIVSEEGNNMVVELHFLQDESEEMMV